VTCAVEPRTASGGLVRNNRVPWEGRDEDKADVGTEATFAAAGFTGVSRPTVRRAVVRIDF
jgi:hypothetical protein